ncbi:TetR family transcriptional regulator [Domibacillus antri]|uniref:TetR family transcriptional regulator n=1 Tax=Domibacillus antri TaxID=1714264 RepID=A0A1Q8Q8L4_9BACI|nr:TetR/AcrR family transcriptional regulator C-terminal domain-containing protein [Domibacillus antri]OLN23673.1 TetR family transcriptional regulator [Domibacillus antri]
MSNHTKQRTTQFIMKALLDLLAEKPFSAITVNDICDKSMIHRSTFYRYYDDKYDLFNQVISIIGHTLYERALSRQTNRTLFEELIEYVDENRALFLNVTVNNENADLYNELIKMSSQILFENAQTMDDALSRKIHQSPYPKILCDFYSSGLIEVLKQWINKNYDYSKEKLVEILNELLS